MSLSDPLSNGLTKIRNAVRARHATVDILASKMNERILNVLKQEGFIRSFKPVGENPVQRVFRIYLKYVKKTSVITQIVRVSKPGVRVWKGASELPRVLGGMGIAIVSTSSGVMTEQQAFKQRIGGEVLCYVW